MANDALGDRCKQFEMHEAGRRAMPGLPLIARLDGRAFHTFTRGLRRPYDERMSRCMIETARFLIEDQCARIGYTQSDEITLLFHESDAKSQLPFDGRFQKLTSVLAGLASARFYKLLLEHLPDKAETTPCFDCRVWQVPTSKDALDVFVWREDDAVKNSVSMAAGAYYSDSELHGKDAATKHELLFQKGVNWNDYPAFFKRGTYLQRRSFERELSEEERQRIPERHRPPEGQLFQRSRVVELDLLPIRKLGNAEDVLFRAAEAVPRGPSPA